MITSGLSHRQEPNKMASFIISFIVNTESTMSHFLTVLSLGLILTLTQSRTLWDQTAIPEKRIFKLNETDQIEFEEDQHQLQISGLEGTLYTKSLSKLQNVKELRIVKNKLEDIQSAALCPSPNLKILELDFSTNKNPPRLRKDMFDNCSIEELFIKFTYGGSPNLDNDFLKDLSSLRVLGIDSLYTSHLSKNSIVFPPNLKSLIISSFRINATDNDVFNLSNLEELEIIHNAFLEQLPSNIFKQLPKLKTLKLSDNALKKLTWDEFEGLDLLESLDVTDNLIENFDADKIVKNMPKLKHVSIGVNSLTCQQMQQFSEQLKAKFNHSVEVEFKHEFFYKPCQ